MHLIDANVLITAHNDYYPTNRVPEFWTWVLHHAEHDRIKMPIEMLDEVQAGTGDKEKDLLFEWLQQPGVSEALHLKEDVNPTMVRVILDGGYAANLNDVELETIGRDPFLMAYAFAKPTERCVVTNEIRRPSAQRANRKIPDICDHFGLQTCNAFRLIRKLDFSTSWAG